MQKSKHVLIILTALFLLTGCYSKDEKKLIKQYKKQGEINAINYIKKKYNLDTKVKSIKEEKYCSSLMPIPDCAPSGDVIVKLSTKEKDFSVYITGENDSIDGADDYQINKIEKDIINFLKSNIPINLYDYKLTYNSTRIEEYYENNLEIILPYIKEIELYYIGKNNLNKLNITKVENFLKPHKVSLKLINFETKEKCNEYKISETKNVSLSKERMKNIYKESSLELYQGKKTFNKFKGITNYNNEVFVYSPEDENKHQISTASFNDLNQYKNLYTDLADKKLEQITKAYSIPSTSSLLYIYFPKNKVSAKEYEKIFFISECIVDGEKKYNIDKYFGMQSKMKIGSLGNYYLVQQRYSQCDNNSNITFGLIRVNNAQQ